jgi:CheY-like chemotaxis protein
MKTILLVEDDTSLADGLIMNLEGEGYQVAHVDEGNLALEAFADGNIDLILLDIMLPGMDGLTICRRLREQGETVPILFITARGQADERIEGLVAGGDDYITKPFALKELLARVAGIFRRQAWLTDTDQKTAGEYTFDGRRINFRTFEAEGMHGGQIPDRKTGTGRLPRPASRRCLGIPRFSDQPDGRQLRHEAPQDFRGGPEGTGLFRDHPRSGVPLRRTKRRGRTG